MVCENCFPSLTSAIETKLYALFSLVLKTSYSESCWVYITTVIYRETELLQKQAYARALRFWIDHSCRFIDSECGVQKPHFDNFFVSCSLLLITQFLILVNVICSSFAKELKFSGSWYILPEIIFNHRPSPGFVVLKIYTNPNVPAKLQWHFLYFFTLNNAYVANLIILPSLTIL